MATRVMLVMMMVLMIGGAALAQLGPPAIDDPVPLQVADPGNVPPIPAAQVQGTTEVGNPAAGNYDILINGWIEAYARVSAYDNWIDFGVMNPIHGSYAAPQERVAFSETGEGTYALAGEDGGQNPLYEVNSSTMNFDLAGLQIQTNAGLDLIMNMGGYLTRCQSDGTPFLGLDTRRPDGGYYQLRNQAKMVLHGRFLLNGGPLDPLQGDAGTQYISPTSTQTTDYNTWTDWSAAGALIAADPDPVNGWFEPDTGVNDPWTGLPALAWDGGHAQIGNLDLVVERGQAQASGTAEAAEIWWTQRVWRRGLQDVAGNYRADMLLTLTYRESDARWNPVPKP